MTTKTNDGRPWWMINGAPEPLGDIGIDRIFGEWIRLTGPVEEGKESSTAEKPAPDRAA